MALVVVPRDAAAPAAVARALPGAGPAVGPAVAGAGDAAAPDAWHVAVGAVLLLVGAGIGIVFEGQGGYHFVPAAGVSAFALFYVFAQALERITELVSLILPGSGRVKPAGGGAVITKRDAVRTRDAAFAAAINGPSPATLSSAATAQNDLDRIRLNRAVLAWTFTSALAMAGSGWLGLRLIAAISKPDTASPPALLDLVITGLVIGGGTKPLHDLIAGLQDSRKAKQDPPAAGGT